MQFFPLLPHGIPSRLQSLGEGTWIESELTTHIIERAFGGSPCENALTLELQELGRGLSGRYHAILAAAAANQLR